MRTDTLVTPATGKENRQSSPGATMEVDEFREKVAKGEIRLRDMTLKERELYGHLVPLSKRGWD